MDKKRYAEAEVPAAEDSPMKAHQYFGDAMTAVSINIIVNIAAVITYFYTDILGLAAGAVGTALLLSKVIDAFTDVGMGVLVDRTKSKHGKARPWLGRMAIPSLVGIVLLFTVPRGIGSGYQLVYAAITNTLLLAGIYTAISVPAGSLLSLETKNPHERARMGILRLVLAYAAGMMVSSLMIPAANRLGGGQTAWIVISVVYGVISAGSLAAVFFCVRENNAVQSVTDEKLSPLEGAKLLFKNKYWIIALAVNVLIQLIYAMGVAETYYMKYIFGDENLVALTGIFRLGFVGAGFVLSGLFVKRLGKRNMILIGMVVSISGCVLRAVNPYHLSMNLTGIGLATLGGVPVLAVIGAMIADSIEYGEWKTGRRTVGLASSANSFAGKLGSAVFVGAVGWLLGLSGYNGMLAEQPIAASRMIVVLNVHIPLVCYCIIFAVMMFYDLDKKYSRILSELEAKRINE